ncbi:hypothetical protein RF11_15131 [Thelohanellus kitauei]|uniref:Uncharacterized protein n=1 Tax=Thelohanellus kitauei TaxID=669202 RepID=A0A0C2MRH8_THEKT|nr:hypothetical protein RF11_15131 [Thelohanellus kitauei]
MRQDCKYRNKSACKKKWFGSFNKNKNSKEIRRIISTINSKIQIQLSINGKYIGFELDMGSLDNFLSFADWKIIGKPRLSPCSYSYRSADGSLIPVVGCFDVEVSGERVPSNRKHMVNFVVSKIKNLNLIGLNSVSELEISIDELIQDNRRTTVHCIVDKNLKQDATKLAKELPSL